MMANAINLRDFAFQDRETPEVLATRCINSPFRLHHDTRHSAEDVLVAYRDKTWYLVKKEIFKRNIFIENLYRADLHEGLDVDGQRYLLINTYPLSGDQTTWRTSVDAIVRKARRDWIGMTKIAGQEGYQGVELETDYAAPDWGHQSFEEVVALAFADRLITLDSLPQSAPQPKRGFRHHAPRQAEGDVSF